MVGFAEARAIPPYKTVVKYGGVKVGTHSISFKGVTPMTKQQFRDGTRVDAILKKYATMGVDANDVGLFQNNVAKMQFGVADTAQDYQAMLNRVIRVQEYFKALPSGVREKFRNEPANMLAFMSDPKNVDECVKLGLFSKQADPAKPEEKAAAAPAASSASDKK